MQNALRYSFFCCLFFIEVLASSQSVYAKPLTYRFAGTISSVSQNENDAVPNLMPGDPFIGYTTFESTGWHATPGIVSTTINGVELLFTGSNIYGEVGVIPSASYSIRVGADAFGSIDGSTFAAGNFGFRLEDTDGSAGYTQKFPMSLNLSEFEQNSFLIWGSMYPSGDTVTASGALTEFYRVPEPSTFGLCWMASCILVRRKGTINLPRCRTDVSRRG